MRTLLFALAGSAFAATVLAACVGDIGEGKIAAEVAAPSESRAPATPAPADAVTVRVDTSRSTLRALGAKVTATHPIDFHRWQGSLSFAGDALVDLDFTVDIDSLESDHPKLTTHLKNEDFLHAEKFPRRPSTGPRWSRARASRA